MVKRVNGRKLTESKTTESIDMSLLFQAVDSGLLDNDLARELEIVSRDFNLGNYTISRICYFIMGTNARVINGTLNKCVNDLNYAISLAAQLESGFESVNELLSDLVSSDSSATEWVSGTIRLLSRDIKKLNEVISKLNNYKSKYED